MAWENHDAIITVPATTGLAAFRFVKIDSAGKAAYPAAGIAPIGVSLVSTTGSTRDVAIPVQIVGVAKVSAPGSTVAKGDIVSASSVGRARALSAGDYAVGYVVDGSSGSTGRILSVLLQNIGTT